MSFQDDIDDMDIDVGASLGEVSVSYQPTAGPPVELLGMFDREYVELGNAQARVDSRGPSLFLRATEVAKLVVDPRQEDGQVTIDGQLYQVRKRVNDGPAGRGVRLHLHRIGA